MSADERDGADGTVLRQASPADGPAIAALHVASWRSAYRGLLDDAFLDGPVEQERGRIWAERFAGPPPPGQIVVVAERPDEPGRVLGFACILVRQDPRHGSLVDNLHVDPGHKRLRIGRRLLAASAGLVAGEAADEPIHLYVLDGNARAIAAYESWGGTLDERFDNPESDGRLHPIRRYRWPSPRALAGRLGPETLGGAR